MIELEDFKVTLEQMLNGTYLGRVLPTRPSDEYFKVKTYASFLDTIADKTQDKNFIPVYVHSPDGAYQPIPDLEVCDQSYLIEIYFPFSKKDNVIKFGNYLAKAVSGHRLPFSSEPYTADSYAVCNVSVGVFGQVQPQAMERFIEFLDDSYHLPIQKTEMWGSLQIRFYMSSSPTAIFGNQIETTLKMTFGASSSSESLLISETSANMTNTPASQQLISGTYAKAIISNTAFGKSITVFPRVNSFWKIFIDNFNKNTLQNATFEITKTYNDIYKASDSPMIGTYTTDILVLDIQENVELGKPLSYTLTFTEAL